MPGFTAIAPARPVISLTDAAWEWLLGIDSALAFILGVIVSLLWVLWRAVFGAKGEAPWLPRRAPQSPENGTEGP